MGYRVGSILLFALAQLRFFAFAPFCFCVLFLELLCFFAFVPMNFFVIPSHYFSHIVSFGPFVFFSDFTLSPPRFCAIALLCRLAIEPLRIGKNKGAKPDQGSAPRR